MERDKGNKKVNKNWIEMNNIVKLTIRTDCEGNGSYNKIRKYVEPLKTIQIISLKQT